mgnify:CR=1 FL=1
MSRLEQRMRPMRVAELRQDYLTLKPVMVIYSSPVEFTAVYVGGLTTIWASGRGIRTTCRATRLT